MAFQASSLPLFAAAKSEMWPSTSNAMKARLSLLYNPTKASRQLHIGRNVKSAEGNSMARVFHETPLSFTTEPSRRTILHSPTTSKNALSAISRRSYTSLRPDSMRAMVSQKSIPTLTQPRFHSQSIILPRIQRRTLFGSSSVSTSVLAKLEENANSNPNSASSQYGFYSALLRANMPAIVVERYETNQFVTNAAIDALYQRALTSMQGQQPATGQFGGQHIGVGQHGNLSTAQLQAVGQAVAASTRGGNLAVSGTSSGTGAKDSPLHVVVEETLASHIFKWVKMILYFGLFTYVSLLVITMVIEGFSTFKKIGGKSDNEAKAEQQTVKFSDVHGCDEAKEELQELVDFLKNPEKFSTLGGKLPKGVLLVGPPGTGKTLIARAIAGEAGVPFFFMSGSEFDEMYVGVGAKRMRELFASAKAKSPAIVFIDELDAVGGQRQTRDASYHRQTLNQLLTELDGFEQNSGVIIVAATNFPETLDKALTRPGRFDRNVVVGLPDVRGRIAILKHHMKKIVLGKDVNLEALAAGTPGFSGAELENIINQAAVHASKAKATAVSMFDFEWAKDKIMMGAEKRSMVITQKEKEATAYHEAGHALVLMFTPDANPLHKITIMPRGMALGITSYLPPLDKHSMGMHEYLAQIDVCMGGKVAEELIYGPDRVSSGVSGDLKHATQIAYAMVTAYGMSPALGNVDLASNHDKLSPETKALIEQEVRRVIEEGRIRATKLISSKRKELELLAKALVDYETLDKEEAFRVVRGEKLEGKLTIPKGPLKLPDVGPLEGGRIPDVPPLPGSSSDDDGSRPGPGGAVA